MIKAFLSNHYSKVMSKNPTKKHTVLIYFIILFLGSISFSACKEIPPAKEVLPVPEMSKRPKNIILMIGDGMGLT